jgi:hypothetical protein
LYGRPFSKEGEESYDPGSMEIIIYWETLSPGLKAGVQKPADLFNF